MQNRKMITMAGLRSFLADRSRSAIYDDITKGRLPKPIKIGGRNYWFLDIVEEYIQELGEAQHTLSAKSERKDKQNIPVVSPNPVAKDVTGNPQTNQPLSPPTTHLRKKEEK